MGGPPDGGNYEGEAGEPPSAATVNGEAGPAPVEPSDNLAGMVRGHGYQVQAGGWRHLPAHDDTYSAPEDRVEDALTLAVAEPARNGWFGKRPARWAILGASRRGLSHQHEGKFREDGLAGAAVHGWHLAAVTDGGGSYALARVGARIAAEAALAGMSERASLSVSPGEQALAEILRAGLQAAYNALFAEADRRAGLQPPATIKDLRSTLLLAAHRELGNSEHLIGGAQVGDGIVVARCSDASLDNASPLIWLGRPDTGPSGNEVLFLQDVQPSAWESPAEGKERVFVRRVRGEHVYCLAMTDGVADDFLPNDQNLWRLERTLLNDVLNRASLDESVVALSTLLDYERPDSFDDRTLACIFAIGDRPWT
jgi:hypothetical protein